MLYALMCKDKPGSLELRMATRPPHVEFLKGLEAQGVLKMAGPLLGDDEKPIGSLVVIAASDKAEAEAIAARDPYAIAGLFASVEIRAFNWVFKNPEA
ncbi:MAG: YciI-like protein [Hoeflea sp.]|uniref:YciI-like protein n=1 Tax=Hoeflea sp. TaxID=1940281 RepID=UPI002730A399|nr:YciI-like protein [Hoeflea sp.]MDP2121454.1 YciI-like protein [Hoeflea sp.]MDP3524155.1 YciI-like protein [Hoeflea sp.]MDZ7600698.1 YciI-like protein [Hoeflea sp.]